MSSTKSPSGRFGSFFGIKRRPSSNLVIRPSSPSYEQQQDPFCTNGPVVTSFSVTAEESSSSPLKGRLGRPEPALVIEIPKFVRIPTRRPGSLSPTFRRQIDQDHEHQLRGEGSDGDEAEHPSNSTGSRSLGKPPPLMLRQGSATSVESLALAAAIAHANGMVLKPDPASANSHRGKSPAIDEYPSPPPSVHGSPQNPRHYLEDEEEDPLHVVGSIGSTGASSLPTTPSLIDSFPTIPHSSLQMGPRDIQPPFPLAMIATEALPVRSSTRPARQRAGSTPDAWSTPAPPVTQRYNSDLDQVWDVEEQDETDRNYPYSLGGLPLPGPPPSAPLPPEPVSPRFQPSAIHKHFHQLELDITSLTRKLTSTSTCTSSAYPSTPESSKILKKSASHSLLRREHSGMSASSAASSSQGILSSASASTFAIPLSNSPHKSDTTPSPYSTRHNSAQAIQPFLPAASNRQRSTTDPLLVASFKFKDKEKRSCQCKEHSKNRCSCRDSSRSRDEKERERENHPKRRFFQKYASSGSQVEKDAAALLASIADQEDGQSTKSGYNRHDSKAFADDELGATIGLAISTPEIPRESSVGSTPMSPASQRSPVDEATSGLSTSWTTNHNGVSPSEYRVQHILPPAELIRLERAGFTTGEGINSRGRDLKLGSPVATSPSTMSPLKSGAVDWSRRSISTSRVDTASFLPIAKTRSQRSGSLAAASPTSLASTLPSTAVTPVPRHTLHGNSGAAKSANALPLTSESKAIRKRSSGPINPHQKLGMVRPMTTPSSPAGGFAPLALPPPPRSRVRSLRSNNGESTDSTPYRRPSTSSILSSSTTMQRPVSIMRKPSFIDMGDDDGRPSLEGAHPDAAPGTRIDDEGSYSSNYGSRTPSVRSRSTTINGRHPPDIANITSVTPLVRGSSYSNRTDDSFLDLGKLSLDTIRSQDEEEIIPAVTTPAQQPPAISQYKQSHGPLGSPYGPTYC